MKWITVIALVMEIGTISPSTSHACWCFIPDVPKAVEKARAVFVGEVVEIVEPASSDPTALPPGRFFTIKFKVEKSWKGKDSAVVDILSAQGKYGCFGYPPVSKGEKYLVYADQAYHNGELQKDWLIITACNRTALVPTVGTRYDDRFSPSDFNRKDATEDLEKLEQTSQPAFAPKRIMGKD